MNNNITEDYCSFEVSKLFYLKGARFICDGNFFSWTGYEGLCQRESPRWRNMYAGSRTPDISRPTHALAIKWIRENFNLFIFPDPVYDFSCWTPRVVRQHKPEILYSGKEEYLTSEEAVEAALLYTLKNLVT